jgi:hypothetical protein
MRMAKAFEEMATPQFLGLDICRPLPELEIGSQCWSAGDVRVSMFVGNNLASIDSFELVIYLIFAETVGWQVVVHLQKLAYEAEIQLGLIE